MEKFLLIDTNMIFNILQFFIGRVTVEKYCSVEHLTSFLAQLED